LEADGWTIGGRVPTASGDGPGAMGAAIAEGVSGFTGVFLAGEPDAVLLLGDRFETLAAAVAASACGVPIVHLHGGEISAGAIDNQFRYAISALASYHFVATEKARRRLIAMGEDASRVVRTGAPGLDHLAGFEPMSREAFNAAAGMTGDGAFLLVTLHPTTLDGADPAGQARALVEALDGVGLPCLVTAANRDPGGEAINGVLREAARERGWVFAGALGPGLYPQAMHHAAAMVGNSSSGIIEAATLGLPVVNIGDRQAGRERSGNVIDCGHGAAEIGGAIRRALAMGRGVYENVYGDGGAGVRIVEALAGVPLGVLRKPFSPPGL
ncbi:MAG TPA: UDP-N-acetylglucosamine 2-epimerase (hydrolyzing), partial [Phycisphaerales bacterium]|nr:UDP-N-acetylglucosamine 2-epimerase (hydrolyzing) [Phycisphaerales bacterium]